MVDALHRELQGPHVVRRLVGAPVGQVGEARLAHARGGGEDVWDQRCAEERPQHRGSFHRPAAGPSGVWREPVGKPRGLFGETLHGEQPLEGRQGLLHLPQRRQVHDLVVQAGEGRREDLVQAVSSKPHPEFLQEFPHHPPLADLLGQLQHPFLSSRGRVREHGVQQAVPRVRHHELAARVAGVPHLGPEGLVRHRAGGVHAIARPAVAPDEVLQVGLLVCRLPLHQARDEHPLQVVPVHL
mmetsp:Transcript_17028/g.47941  ORF Transcript_17028/g.47941 Transcript_17028/m.47941 type:complete len:241 (-) Transcript_17028:51-773(-)